MNKKLYKFLIAIIIILAFVIRLEYVIKMPYSAKQHDIEPAGNGLSYIFTIYGKGTLPQSIDGQYYHPPLHHILSAIFLKLIDVFYEIPGRNALAEGLQYLTLIYSMLIIFVSYKIFKELKFNKKIKLLLTFIISFHPALIILSGSLNNDELCLLLMLWTILRLIKWNKNDGIKNTLILAIATGLSVMTKLVGAIVAFPISVVFIYKLYREVKKSKNKKATLLKYFYKYLLFGLVSLPIGLWYPIRNYNLFKQSLLYIPIPGGDKADPSNFIYVGDKSLYQRLTLFSPELFNPYCIPADDCNMVSYLLKCSIFGEFNWGISGLIYNISLYTNIILIIYTLYCIMKNVISKIKRNKFWKRVLAFTWLVMMISYIKVNLEMPFGCTMDFRYIYINLFIGLIFIGFELSNYRTKEIKFTVIYGLLWLISTLFVTASNYIICAGV